MAFVLVILTTRRRISAQRSALLNSGSIQERGTFLNTTRIESSHQQEERKKNKPSVFDIRCFVVSSVQDAVPHPYRKFQKRFHNIF